MLSNIVLDELDMELERRGLEFCRFADDCRRNLYRKLIKRGVPRRQAARAVFSNKARRALSNTFAVTRAYPVGWFVGEMGQAIGSNKQLPHRFDVDRWIRLT